MPPLRPPALDPTAVHPRSTSGYPEPYRSRVLPRYVFTRKDGSSPEGGRA